MTQKELLYVEDAIHHEESIIGICNYAINSLDNKDLVSFFNKELKKHMAMKEKLIGVLEDKSNE